VTSLGQDERKRLLELPNRLHRRVIDQDEAVNVVAEAVVRSRSGLGEPNQPSGSFLFLGPTGVGKTELAKALAEQLFGNEKLVHQQQLRHSPHRRISWVYICFIDLYYYGYI
jgi:ATP-dependent Clp protease ATP-binding subunit ClpB